MQHFVRSQELSLFQPLNIPGYYNPSAVGMYSNNQYYIGTQQNYLSIPDHYSSAYSFADFSIKRTKEGLNKIGMGVYAINEEVGATNYQTNKFGTSLSVAVPVLPKGEIRAGVAVNFNQVSLNPSKVILADQLDPFLGLTMSQSPSMPNNILDLNNYVNIGFGFYFKNDFNRSNSSWFNKNVLEFGLAYHNILSEDYSLLQRMENDGFGQKVEPKLTLNISYFIPLMFWGPNITLSTQPYVLYEKQNSFENINYGFNVNMSGFILGLSFRNQQYERGNISLNVFNFGYVIPSAKNTATLCFSYATPNYNSSMSILNSCFEISIGFVLSYRTKKRRRQSYGMSGYLNNFAIPNTTKARYPKNPYKVCPECCPKTNCYK